MENDQNDGKDVKDCAAPVASLSAFSFSLRAFSKML
jgi:hypothetical protein